MNVLTGQITLNRFNKSVFRRMALDAGSAVREVATLQAERFNRCLRKPAPSFDLLIRSHHCTDNCLGRLRILLGNKVDRSEGRTAL